MGVLQWGVPVVAVLTVVGVQAQEAEGTWQGVLHADKDLRCQLLVTKGEGGFKGKFFSLDQGAGSLPTGPVSLQGGSLTFSIPLIDAKYEGKLSADGSTATGTWTQGGKGLPLALARVKGDAVWSAAPATERLAPMPATADPSFEVATIKPSQPDERAHMLTIDGSGKFATRTFELSQLISFAYEVQPKQVLGLPAWASTDKMDIEAKADTPGMPNDKQVKSMLKKLLAERFKLTFHEEKRELPVYALGVGKTGPKLTKSDADPNGLPGLFFRGLGRLAVRNGTMMDFTQLMQSVVLDRPVVDQTKLEGRYDFTLDWTPDESQFGGMRMPPPPEAADAPPNLYTAMQEQLGLRLEPTKAPVKVLVIDHAEKASEN